MEILLAKLEFTDSKLKGLVQAWAPNAASGVLQGEHLRKHQRAAYVMHKNSLDMAIDEVESWQRVAFNPLWFAIMKIQSQNFDNKLDRSKEDNRGDSGRIINATLAIRNPLRQIHSAHVFLPVEKLESAESTGIAYTAVKSVQIDGKWRLLDTGSDLSKDTVRELAVRLRNADPLTFGLLRCLGATYNESKSEFGLIFRIPDSMYDPETLRARIATSKIDHSLSDRFRLATQLARAVLSIHMFDMVHKNIRPENIILFRDQESSLGSAFLLGFVRTRRSADGTRLAGDLDWEKNIYHHPRRQGSNIRDRYVMQHDIYSLGVCLLEIGLWSTFVEYSGSDHEPVGSQAYDLRFESCDDSHRPGLIKARLLSLAANELLQKMGTKYASIIESCLTCLDLGNEDFGDDSEFADDGADVAIRYIEKVCSRNEFT